eukprot:scaffold5916_cov44-Cyclotella_meneghiniana.AAC.7
MSLISNAILDFLETGYEMTIGSRCASSSSRLSIAYDDCQLPTSHKSCKTTDQNSLSDDSSFAIIMSSLDVLLGAVVCHDWHETLFAQDDHRARRSIAARAFQTSIVRI